MIEGPGEYLSRDGRKVTVVGKTCDAMERKEEAWAGFIEREKYVDAKTWTASGECLTPGLSYGAARFAVVGKWPATVKQEE